MAVILETVNLSKHFGALQAVLNVNLKVREGSIHAVIGPNGAGKTTLFNLLTGFQTPSAGQVFFKDRQITRFPPYRVAHLGIMRSFQITSIFPDMTVLENVRIVVQAGTNKNYRFLKSLKGEHGLEEKAQAVLDRIGLGDKGGLMARNLSHGEKRILDIGIGLAGEPRLLLLDEPASGLVGDEISRVKDLIRDISSVLTVILVEHNIDVVLSISDVITVLYYGEIIAEGTPDQIQASERVQEIYLGASHP